MEKQKKWAGKGFESMEAAREYPMNTTLYLTKLKNQWPLTSRDQFVCLTYYRDNVDRVYLGWKSIEHKDFPEDPKVIRMNIFESFFFWSPLLTKQAPSCPTLLK